ncbi:hypothetical protein [Longispora albida]|uniref:hypothetical protein n=1 Tax=Longispora albida TaxID=203523 RepID=UPI0003775F93|nr:hypothetical protein [Longispora albida]
MTSPENDATDTELANDGHVGQPAGKSVRRRAREFLIPAVAVFLALGWGFAIYYYRTGSAAMDARDDALARVSVLNNQVSTLNNQAADLKGQRDGYASREVARQQHEEQVKQREKAVADRESAVKGREEAVTAQEKTAEQNTIREGTWAVGVDIQPGTYRTKEIVTGQCYWEINSDANGDDIVANAIVTGGRPTVNIAKGQFFTTKRCGEWVRV